MTISGLEPSIRMTRATSAPPTRGFQYRVAEVGSLSAKAKMAMEIPVKRVFAIFTTNASFLRVVANL